MPGSKKDGNGSGVKSGAKVRFFYDLVACMFSMHAGFANYTG
jgi:hypothetical protein